MLNQLEKLRKCERAVGNDDILHKSTLLAKTFNFNEQLCTKEYCFSEIIMFVLDRSRSTSFPFSWHSCEGKVEQTNFIKKQFNVHAWSWCKLLDLKAKVQDTDLILRWENNDA